MLGLVSRSVETEEEDDEEGDDASPDDGVEKMLRE